MNSQDHKLDPHARPSEALKDFYKKYQKLKGIGLANDPNLLDLRGKNLAEPEKCPKLRLKEELIYDAVYPLGCDIFKIDEPGSLIPQFLSECRDVIQIYEHEDMPGIRIVPDLLPAASQKTLLDKLIHRDVSDPAHQSNLHLHYDVEYPEGQASFFSMSAKDAKSVLTPKDPKVHKPLNIEQMLTKKLRWITLGGQYDWTNKVYPNEVPPDFPPDVAGFLQYLFEEMTPQAAIVNFYSPGDTLSLHRDVAEDCDRGLISISIGCDGIFVMGLEDESTKELKMVAMRLRSGDAVYMDGRSRYAWHGVPQIVAGTCPEWLKNWPGDEYPEWKGWMGSKRINLNVRQMWSKT